jgi:hypothetical protein
MAVVRGRCPLCRMPSAMRIRTYNVRLSECPICFYEGINNPEIMGCGHCFCSPCMDGIFAHTAIVIGTLEAVPPPPPPPPSPPSQIPPPSPTQAWLQPPPCRWRAVQVRLPDGEYPMPANHYCGFCQVPAPNGVWIRTQNRRWHWACN